MKVVYRITYPNGKIYVGQDITDCIVYFGSASPELVAADFTREERRSFMIIRDILWESETATQQEVNEVERNYIISLEANNPAKGYNRRPSWRGASSSALGHASPQRQ
ncbi:GIY-YIG nuclease family protein [Bordetella sp. LUAb4]|uniref:GIY-YIG nuclease family protein n=1 Tax=Bordetella sp. LUAb4 TaxID=2843195 RepID=UPI001E572B74|nr:GIY-YIG nuclease family protein [Bordetella sp. LUAb4]